MNLKRLFLFFAAGMLMSICSMAQTKPITGKVTDSTGNGLSGISVLISGTKIGTQTGNDGTFKLNAPANATTLEFRSVNYASQQLPIGNGNVFVSLKPVSGSLNDVVVIGYGSVRKKDLTGSVAVVSEKDFQKGAITTPDQLIAGKVAGVSVISNSGEPGVGSTIRIRGGSSLNASNDPLFVIDGVSLSNDAIAGAPNPLSMINSDDIESFTILKDASATAIYGSRAANGVIIITTKKGKAGALKVNFNTVNSLSTSAKKVDVMNADQLKSVVEATGNQDKIALLGNANTNWQDQIFRNAFGTTNDISISGGVKWLPYRLSIGYQNQDGILRTDNLQKTSLGLALNPTFFNNHLKVDINVKGSFENVRFGNSGAIGDAISFDPTQPVNSGNGKYGGYYEWVDANGKLVANAARNPVGLLNENYNTSTPDRSIGNIQLDYNFPFLPELHVKVNAGYDVSTGEGSTTIPYTAASNYNPDTVTNGGYYNQYKSVVKNSVLEYYLNYVKDFKSIKSHLDAIAGYSYNNYQTTNYEYGDYNYNNTKLLSSGDSTAPYDIPRNLIISFLARASYSYDDRFYLTGSIRDDGSSRFGPYGTGTSISDIGKGNRWGLFPSGAFKWKISNEQFLKNNKVLSDLDVRFGYGITGQQDVNSNYGYLANYYQAGVGATYPFGNQYIQGYRPTEYDAGLRWEQTATTNLGVDFGFLNNRVSGSIDLYEKKTSHLLEEIPEPAGTNFSAFVLSNVGDMSNKGIEFTLNTQPIRSKDINWDVNFNITYNKNKITNLTVVPDDPTFPGVGVGTISGTNAQGDAQVNAVGFAKSTFNLYQQIYNVKTGLPIEGLFNDVNRDGRINTSDLVKDKAADPNLFMGFSTNFSYKKWSAGFVLRASFNNYVYDEFLATEANLNIITGGTVIGNASPSYLQTKFSGLTNSQFLSNYYLYNATFLKMDNFSVGYNVGKVWNGAMLRANLYVQNVFVITKYPGIDPEVSSGIDNNTYPRPRIYSLGFNLNF